MVIFKYVFSFFMKMSPQYIHLFGWNLGHNLSAVKIVCLSRHDISSLLDRDEQKLRQINFSSNNSARGMNDVLWKDRDDEC